MMYWTRERTAAMLPILTAFAEGKTVEFRSYGGDWTTPEEFVFGYEPSRYRIRPTEPVSVSNRDEFDDVNHPKHYVTDASGYECVQLAELLYDGLLFNAFKYLFRDGKKESSPRDIEKSLWYMKRFVAPGDELDLGDVDIYKVIQSRPWPIGEAIRLIWLTTGDDSIDDDKQSVAAAAKILEVEIDRRKEAAK